MFDYSQSHAADALAIAKRLQTAGFIAYFAGGCVRDALLSRPPKDFDVATDATPEKVRELFGKRQTVAFGASFGVIGVLGNAATPTEVATFRSDGQYSDGRRPDSVRFGNAQDDALRRDFTVNGMFYDPIRQEVIDYVGGQQDLIERRVRAIGDASQRIAEDKLRMLRAVRFAAALGFELEPSTLAAIQRTADQLSIVSGERIGAEMRRILGHTTQTSSIVERTMCPSAYAWSLLINSKLLMSLWPSMYQALADDPSLADRGANILAQIDASSFIVAMACLIIEAQLNSRQTIQQLTEAWKLSCDEQRAIDFCAVHHQSIQQAQQLPWSTVQPLLITRDSTELVATAAAVARRRGQNLAGVDHCLTMLFGPTHHLNPEPLLTGDRLKQLGYRPSPQFRQVLQHIRDEQLDQRLNSQAEAEERAKQWFERSKTANERGESSC